jgi:hypothetical protein
VKIHSKGRWVVGLVGLIAAGGILIGSGMAGAGATGRPARPTSVPTFTGPTEMILSGRDGRPIIGRDGKPIKVPVGVVAPSPPPPTDIAGAQVDLTPDQIAAALHSPPVTVILPEESDQQKARRLAPGQAR